MTAPQIPPPGLKGKILVIDDELDIREGLYDLLTLEGGYTVERSEEHTSELQSLRHLVCRLLLEKIILPLAVKPKYVGIVPVYELRGRRDDIVRAVISFVFF